MIAWVQEHWFASGFIVLYVAGIVWFILEAKRAPLLDENERPVAKKEKQCKRQCG